MRTRPALTLLVAGLAACSASSSILEPGAGNDPGTGTGTLEITGSVYASPRRSNAPSGNLFDVAVTVKISLRDHSVGTGTVTVTSASGKVPLTFDGTDSWTGAARSYDQVYVLDVISGDDKVQGARVDGPDIHVFTQPAEREPIDPAEPLLLKWRRAASADAAALRVEPADWGAIPDSGSFSIGIGALHDDSPEAQDHTLRVARTNAMVPAGALAGSTWSATVENDIDVVTPPIPL